MNGGYPLRLSHRRGRAPWQASPPSPAGVNGRGLPPGPRQSPRFGPPISCLRQRSADLLRATVST
jgi:hypothetical protein